MRRIRAFSLVELLVVVAIVGVLSAMFLPALTQARSQGRRVVCMSNMRQIVTAVRAYLGDHRDAYPQTMETVSAALPTTVSWWAIHNYQTALEPYMQQDRGGVEADGRARGKKSVWFDPADPDRDEPAMWGSFSDNGLITGAQRRDGQIRRPAATVFSTLRHADWSRVVGVAIPAPLPTTDPDHPFWVSEYFDMCFDPWAESPDPAHPYHWARGRAAPPRSLFPGDSYAEDWDRQIDGRSLLIEDNRPRYGHGQPYAYCDGHVGFHAFERTYAAPESNDWDIE